MMSMAVTTVTMVMTAIAMMMVTMMIVMIMLIYEWRHSNRDGEGNDECMMATSHFGTMPVELANVPRCSLKASHKLGR